MYIKICCFTLPVLNLWVAKKETPTVELTLQIFSSVFKVACSVAV